MDTPTFSVPDDVRFGEIIKKEEGKEQGFFGSIVLLGFPYDIGVERNGGRLGSCEGPASVRKLHRRIGALVNEEYEMDISNFKISDIGDIKAGLALEEAHDLLRRRVCSIVSEGKIPFVIGGGNDQSYPNAAGLLDALAARNIDTKSRVGVVNIDAHLDVRPLKNGLVHSGSPFRLLLEDERFSGEHFAEFACQGSQCSSEHVQYVKNKGGKLYWLKQLRESNVAATFEKLLNELGEDIFVSFDIDSISAADVPGVSCPAAVGLTSQEALDICFIAGKHPKVRLFDVSEYNPRIEEYRTGRFVGYMLYYFALGYSQRYQ